MLKPMPAAMMGAMVGIALGSLATVLLMPGARRADQRAPAPISAPMSAAAPSAAPLTAGDGAAAPRVRFDHDPEAAQILQARLAALENKSREQEKLIAELKEQVADEQAQRVEIEGVPVDWPAEISEQFKEDTLRKNFTAALAEAGFEGEVTDIDCNEYPCIVYGKLNDDDGTTLDRLQGTKALQGYKDATNSTSAWGGLKKRSDGEHREAVFGIALYPKEKDEERRGQIDRRLRVRHQAFWDQAKADEAP